MTKSTGESTPSSWRELVFGELVLAGGAEMRVKTYKDIIDVETTLFEILSKAIEEAKDFVVEDAIKYGTVTSRVVGGKTFKTYEFQGSRVTRVE